MVELDSKVLNTNLHQSARGAILIFLILQMTSSTSDLSEKVGVSNPLKEYLKFLPARVHLPTFWNEAERAHLRGTSLEAALNTKLSFLDREFTRLKDATTSISWCQRHWWDPETGHLSLDDWKQVDALYRSRALDLPGTGHAMVPCIDMANHAQGDSTVALYDTDINGDGVLVMREGKGLVAGEEVTITYGDDKGACEMLFSYGFIEESMLSAKELFLDLEFPEDDPLRYAKKAVSKCAPGFRLFYQGDLIEWEGTFIWLLCVNEEDGFQIQYLQNYRGEKELKVSWKDNHVKDMSHLHGFLKDSTLWDVFNLRALIILQERVWTQLSALEGSKMDVKEMGKLEDINASVRDNALQLRDLEETLLLHAYEEFEERVLFHSVFVCRIQHLLTRVWAENTTA